VRWDEEDGEDDENNVKHSVIVNVTPCDGLYARKNLVQMRVVIIQTPSDLSSLLPPSFFRYLRTHDVVPHGYCQGLAQLRSCYDF